jgi:NADPH:quinone reductase-like Zn-dependent oxidoreductase
VKAAIVKAPGVAPEYGDFAEPIVNEGCELVELVAAGIHNVVRSLAAGHHYGSAGTWPQIPGIDAVVRTPAGDLVYTGFIQPPYGTFAERMAAPLNMRFPLPAGTNPVHVAGGLNPGLASWLPLNARVAEIAKLGTVLVVGASGMAGLLAVQHALILGATHVVGLGRSPARLECAEKLGARTVALTGEREADAAALVDALAGTAPSIVLNYLWASAAETAFAALARRGFEEDAANIAYVQIGSMAGPEAAVPAELLRSRHIHISGSGAGSASIADAIAQVPAYIRMIADRTVDVPTRTYRLSSIAEAWTTPASSTQRNVIVPG